MSAAFPAQAITARDFDEVVRKHQRRVYRVLMFLLRDPDEADSLTQECFLRAYQNLEQFRGESSFETWLLRIAVNLARDHGRNRRVAFWKRLFGLSDERVSAQVMTVAAPGPTPEQTSVARAEVKAVWKAVEGLSQQQRTIFALRFVEEMELHEIAEVLELKVGSVKAQLFRAVHEVRDTLREQQWR